MLKQIAGTTATKILTTALGFFTVILATQFLGAEQYGNISMFVLSISLLQLVSGIAGGPALVYLVPRMTIRHLFAGALCWTLAVHLVAFIFLYVSEILPTGQLRHLIQVSLLFFLNTFAYTCLLGKKRIRPFNLILLLQALSLLCALGWQIVFLEDTSLMVYIRALYVSSGLSALAGWFLILGYFQEKSTTTFGVGFRKMVRHGGFLQIANGVQLLNYRLSYFLIDQFAGRAYLGIYTAGVQLSEGIWIFGKSFAVVQYSSISNNSDPEYARTLSLRLLKATFFITLGCLSVLWLLPSGFYSFVFGKGFDQVKLVVMYLSAGVLALGISQIFSHYFSGTGRQQHNAIGSAVGLVVTAVSGFILIPAYGLAGAGITASLAYSVSTIYQLIVFVKVTRSRLGDFMVKASEVRQIWALLRRTLKR